jgi:predicted RNA-binding protein with PIN domain
MLLIDTYNVLHVSGILPADLAGLEADELARLIAQSRYAGRMVKLVCDGVRPGATPRPGPGAEFLFAGAGQEADSLIERIIAANSAPRRLLVVSSDRRVLTAARRRRAATLTSEAFLAQLAADRVRVRTRPLPAFTQDLPLDAHSVAHWMREFGLDPGDVDELRRRLAARERPRGHAPASGKSRSEVPASPSAPVTQPEPTPGSSPLDPLLLAAMEAWPGRISPDDLDMRKWLADARADAPERRPRGRRPRG